MVPTASDFGLPFATFLLAFRNVEGDLGDFRRGRNPDFPVFSMACWVRFHRNVI
jgi:hypothetical protein